MRLLRQHLECRAAVEFGSCPICPKPKNLRFSHTNWPMKRCTTTKASNACRKLFGKPRPKQSPSLFPTPLDWKLITPLQTTSRSTTAIRRPSSNLSPKFRRLQPRSWKSCYLSIRVRTVKVTRRVHHHHLQPRRCKTWHRYRAICQPTPIRFPNRSH